LDESINRVSLGESAKLRPLALRHLKYEAWGQGYATEAAQVLLSYGFDTLHLPEIYAVANPKNERSLQVMRRLGMTRLGRTNRYYNQELELFEIKAHDWKSQKSS